MFWKKNNKQPEREETFDTFARTYNVELYSEKTISILQNDILDKLNLRCGETELLASTANAISFSFKDYMIEYSDAKIPAQIAIVTTDKKPDNDSLEMAFWQSWRWKNARETIEKSKMSVLITDLMTSGLNYKSRLQLFQNALYSVLETTSCDAIYWQVTQQFIKPSDYLANVPGSDKYNLLFGALNVRLFNIEGSKEEVLMDTLGLSAFGLPDLQCHFMKLDVNTIAQLLYTYGDYIFEHGDVIEDGNTIQGPNDKLICRHEVSLMEPKRVVLDIHPGEEYAAGNRY